jgi:hypothetical protein
MVARVLERYLGVARAMTCGDGKGASVEVEVGKRDGKRSSTLAQSFEGILIFQVWKLSV